MSLILNDIQKVALAIQPVSRAGNPAPVDGVPVWSSSNPEVIVVKPAANGLSAMAETTGALGTAQVQCVADADLGEGVVQITAVLDVEVQASQAFSLGITAGVPEERN